MLTRKGLKMSKNPYAKALANPLFRKRIIRAQKGKGAYIRKEKHPKNG
jgi:stalled ribosome alternative rescue factor ArfA